MAAARRAVRAAVFLAAAAPLARGAGLVAAPDEGSVLVCRDGDAYLDAQALAWGPGWAWMKYAGSTRAEGGAAVQTLAARDARGGAALALAWTTRAAASNRLEHTLALSAPRDARLTCAVLALAPGAAFAGGALVVAGADGTAVTNALPLARGPVASAVRAATLVDAAGRRTALAFDPPADLAGDGALRVMLAGATLRADAPVRQTVTVDAPEAVAFHPGSAAVPDEPGLAAWYPWAPPPAATGAPPSRTAMDAWSPERAGARGRVTARGADLVYDGRPARFWGLNLCYAACAPEAELADRRAAFYRALGVNAVRLHKYADGHGWNGIQSAESAAEFDPAGLARMDYQVARLVEAGVYVKLSAQFGVISIGPADLRDVPYAEEFGAFGAGKRKGNRVTPPASAFVYSPEIQALHLRQATNLLAHVNPHTGRSYAAEPGLLALEIINENSVLFFTSMKPLQASATLRRTVGKRFCDFLRARYGTAEELRAAWGDAAFNSFGAEGFAREGESLDADNLLPLGNPWFWDPDQLAGSQAFRRRRLLDSLEFLHGLQLEAYRRWVAGVRRAGYEGEILASNWQAGRGASHYYNLHSDAAIGLVDRHNYFGGNRSMLAAPGGGILSAGMQQVADRPFMLSEWIHTFPGEWHAEGPAIVAAYGLGLQGWDVSFLFQNNDEGAFSDRLGRAAWDVTAPQIAGLFPAVARQVRRGDVRAAAARAVRHVSLEALRDARLGFADRVGQDHDIKTFDSDRVTARALAVARCVVEFGEPYRDTPPFDAEAHRDGGAYLADTGELRWTPGAGAQDGFFTMDTPATKAVVGFAGGRRFELGGVGIAPATRFAAVYVTAREPAEDLATGRSLLVVAIARARNTGMKWLGGARLLERGGPPVLMEPVRAEIRLARPGSPAVHVLDQAGRRTGRTLPVANGVFTIDGAETRTPYYEVSYE